MKNSSPTDASDSNEHFENNNTRNVCFVLADGKMKFFNYGYLISGDYMPDDGKIILSFTSDTVILEGSKLEPLYFEFTQHLPRTVVCTDKRYNAIEETDKPIINSITITKAEQ